MKPKVIAIVGTNASGKSDLGVVLAKKFDGEIVSADSRQIYRGLDIGSGKITKREMKGVHHHLLDIANPRNAFSVQQYQNKAHRIIADILKRGKLPIIVGGTGQYVEALIDNPSYPIVPTNARLRRQLEKQSTKQLFSKLKKLDPKRARSIEPENPRRLVRAIEIATALGSVPKVSNSPLYEPLMLGITHDKEVLRKRMEKRMKARMGKGLVSEVKQLRESGLSWKRLDALGLEYRFVAELLRKKITREELEEKIVTGNMQYAKRQMTWFKRDKRIHWMTSTQQATKLARIFTRK